MTDAVPAHKSSLPSAQPAIACWAAAVAGALLISAAPAFAETCPGWRAEFISVEGSVEIRRSNAPAWTAAAQGASICSGDTVRTNAFSRATVRLPDMSLQKLGEHSALTFRESEDEQGSWLDVLRGIIHVISRDPRSLQFNTPYANAGLEGTEFVIAVDDAATEVTVVEGEVRLSNAAGDIGVPRGQRGSAGPSGSPLVAAAPDPFDQMRWTPYFAPVLFSTLPAADAAPPGGLGDAAFYTARAARRIGVGQVADAEADLEAALALAPNDPRPHALRVPLALSRGDKAAALDYARRAVEADPASATALIALSHAEQARFDLTAAQESLQRAVEAEPVNALAWARLAEVQLARGVGDRGVGAAARAAALDPGLAHVETILGFHRLGRGDAAQAVEAFERAAARDQTAPLPRMGLALALIRAGEFERGRAQLELAVVLDPTNALVRSYMAKIYATEGRLALSASQLELAQTLDASDSTPFLYRALIEQKANHPIEALHALEAAAGLNDHQPVYRSRMQLDDDLAVRSAGVGQLYRTLDFEQLALLNGWSTTGREPDNYSGHRLLADVYSERPRHQIARVNEMYLSQLLQPLNLTPIQPQLGSTNLSIAGSAGPSELAFTEFAPLVRQDGLSFQGSAVAGGNGTSGSDVAVAAVHDNVAYSLGRFDIRTDGFRENNSLDQSVSNALVQIRATPSTSVQAEYRYTQVEKGDLKLLFDPEHFNPALMQDEDVRTARIGITHRLNSRNSLLASLNREQAQESGTTGSASRNSVHSSSQSLDLRHTFTGRRWSLTSGVRRFSEDLVQSINAFALVVNEQHNLAHTSAFAYGRLAATARLSFDVGLSADFLDAQWLARDQLNPKVGLTWSPTSRTRVRAAAFSTLQGPFNSKQSIQPRLEPTHVSGFNQFFFGSAGERSWRYGAAIDHRISESLYAGLEASTREVETPFTTVFPGFVSDTSYLDVDERSLRSYVYWTPAQRLSFSAEYEHEDIDNNGQILDDGHARLTTDRMPLTLSYFGSSRLHSRISATYLQQKGLFSRVEFDPAQAPEYGQDEFWVFDWSLTYRLPKRHGSVSLRVDNLLDEEFRFQDTDPEFTRIMPERMLSLRFTLAY